MAPSNSIARSLPPGLGELCFCIKPLSLHPRSGLRQIHRTGQSEGNKEGAAHEKRSRRKKEV
ncbi:hypothetical protein [Lampropedia puyangensis]|uniref:hypothetical protein n=1 Tax=Lampropedia puyangensis TaxID=1330072 RepID=UPI0010A8D182|nr:hypothetical protein [Lampropedia puyangensis]